MIDIHRGDHRDLEQRRRSITTAGRLHWFHWVVVGFSLVVTISAWHITKSQLDEKFANEFEAESAQIVELVQERMQKYEDGLWGGVSAVESHGGDMSFEQWQAFAESLRIDDKYPGINGIGVIHHVAPDQLDAYLAQQRSTRPDYGIYPEHDADEFYPISYIIPVEANSAAVGLDMAHEANRYQGIERARDTGAATVTGPIVLVQDEQRTPGFLFFAPWYQDGDPGTREQREQRFLGVVYAPFVADRLMHGVLDATNRDVAVGISDNGHTLYDEHLETTPGFDPDPLLSTTVDVAIYGRTWTFDLRTTTTFRTAAAHNEPLVILVGGLTLDGLLLCLFVMLSRSNRRALRFADDIARDLHRQQAQLAESNAELERFAYVASHDLKTPLRGIAHLTEYLEDDLQDYVAAPDANPDVKRNIDRLHDQVHRMSDLVSGILDYSRLGSGSDGEPLSIDMSGLMEQLTYDLSLQPHHLSYIGPASLTLPGAVSLTQVIQNLVTNAIVHHHNPTAAHVRVIADDRGNAVRFAVIDNGPGIDSAYHQRIFELCHTLGTPSHGSGIGLSIVDKAVRSQGGNIDLTSAPGAGSTFAFSWFRDDQPRPTSSSAHTEMTTA